MGRSSSLLTSTPSPLSLLPSHWHPQPLFWKKHLRTPSSLDFLPWTKRPSNISIFAALAVSPLQATENKPAVETIPHESECIEIGYISSVHGFKGEVRVKPTTDSPELRFSKPGRRWVKVRESGRESIREVELTKGRDHPGQKCWILTFSGFDSDEKATQLVGSTLLIRKTDRPELKEGEFYTPDLVSMKVVLKETGEPVGTVVDVYNTGGNNLLQVMLSSSGRQDPQLGSLESETGITGPFAWIPFVKAIVPHVDMRQREMLITPPKGLLELNLPSYERSKKERRYLEWKQRKKFGQCLAASKKKLIEMGQEHVLQGFSYGKKSQKEFLSKQVAGINFKFLQQAMQLIDKPYSRCDLTELLDANSSKFVKNAVRISKDYLVHSGNNEEVDMNHKQYERGLNLMSEAKIASIWVMNGKKVLGTCSDSDFFGSEGVEWADAFHLRELLLHVNKTSKADGWCTSVPLIIVSTSDKTQIVKNIFSENDCFGYDCEKVQFLEEEKLPVVSSLLTEQSRHKILVKSPWEIIEAPVGSGGVFGLFLRHHIIENFNEMGIEYVEVCSLNQGYSVGHPLFPGFVDSCKADIGIKVLDNCLDDCNYDMIFSMRFLKALINQTQHQFYAVPQLTPHVEKVGKEWVDINVASPNSYHLSCSIFSSLDACPADKICLLQVAG